MATPTPCLTSSLIPRIESSSRICRGLVPARRNSRSIWAPVAVALSYRMNGDVSNRLSVGNLCSARYSGRFGMQKIMLACSGAAALMALIVTVAQLYMPYPLLMLCMTIMSLFIAVAIPAMTTLAMQVAGRAYASSAAAALNANRQIGGLVGVALMGIILYTVQDWTVRLSLAFATFTLAFGTVSFLVYRFVNVTKPTLFEGA